MSADHLSDVALDRELAAWAERLEKFCPLANGAQIGALDCQDDDPCYVSNVERRMMLQSLHAYLPNFVVTFTVRQMLFLAFGAERISNKIVLSHGDLLFGEFLLRTEP